MDIEWGEITQGDVAAAIEAGQVDQIIDALYSAALALGHASDAPRGIAGSLRTVAAERQAIQKIIDGLRELMAADRLSTHA